MSTVIERIQELRRRRQGRYFDLCRESGKGNGQFIDDDLRELDETALLLGKTERTLADDLTASRRFDQLSRQLAEAEDQKPAAEKNIAELNDQIKQAVADRNAANDARQSARHRRDTEAARAGEQAYTRATSDISRLQNEVKAARKPLAACELVPKEITKLVALHPWVRGGTSGH